MLEIKLDKQFKKDIKRAQKSEKYQEDDYLYL
jgi:mRNA-degrading endonuclease YafQ of YafQ-DinJ toxin-antitoxin module